MRINCKKIPWITDPFSFYRAFRGQGPSVLLESARTAPHTGRYSVLGADPFLVLRYENGGLFLEHPRSGRIERRTEEPFSLLRKLVKKYSVRPGPGWPSFATGAVGYVGYECKDLLEPRAAGDASKARFLPDMYFLFLDECLVWDHHSKELWLCSRRSLGNLEKRVRSAVRRAAGKKKKKYYPQAPLNLEPSLDPPGFERAVRKAKEYIRQGEIFQANLAQRFSFLLEKEPEEVYEQLRKINPSPFFGFLDAKDFQVISGSPERLLKLEGQALETRPIAGTRWRGKTGKEDERLALELLLSEKERAEHIMLVDLERNDLGRVARYGSIAVDELMALEDYSHVKHIVSNVRGILRGDLSAVDAFCAFFPGGTITGAPKVRCMQVIEELEPVSRGPYTGSLGYFSFTGDMDFNILIRGLAVRDRRAHLHVGAGIVADSDPRKEYHETLYKAEAVLSAVFGEEQVRTFFRRCGLGARLS